MAALCVLASCSNTSKQEKADSSSVDSVQTSVMSFQDCDLTLGGIHFTKMLNEADKQVSARRLVSSLSLLLRKPICSSTPTMQS